MYIEINGYEASPPPTHLHVNVGIFLLKRDDYKY